MQALTLQIGIGSTMCAFWTYVGATARLGNALGWSRDDGFYPVPVPLSLMAAWSFLMIFNFGAFFSPAAATSACDELLAPLLLVVVAGFPGKKARLWRTIRS